MWWISLWQINRLNTFILLFFLAYLRYVRRKVFFLCAVITSIGGVQFYLKLAIQNQINLGTLDTMTKYWNTIHSYCQLHTHFYLYMTPPTIPSSLSPLPPPHTHSNHPQTLQLLPHAPPTNPTHSQLVKCISLHPFSSLLHSSQHNSYASIPAWALSFFSFFRLFLFLFLLSPFILSSGTICPTISKCQTKLSIVLIFVWALTNSVLVYIPNSHEQKVSTKLLK